MKGIIFIDGGNLFHSVKNYNARTDSDLRVDFKKLPAYVSDHVGITELLRTYYYTGVPKQISSKQMGFLTLLETLPHFEVKKKELKRRGDQLIEKGVDVLIVTDMLWMGLRQHCEHIVLVSGDEDLTDAVVRLKDNGVRVTVAAFKESTSKRIQRAADTYIDLSEHARHLSLDT